MFNNKVKLKELIHSMYDVADVERGYNYWFNRCLNTCLSMIEYDGAPETIPEREILLNLICTNHCVFFEKKGDLYVTPTTLYDNQKSPYYYPQSAVYAQPYLGSDNLKIGVNAEIVYNDSLQDNIFYLPTDGGLLTYIQRHARMLADIESTISIYTVNARLTSFPTAANDNVKTSIERLFDKITLGRRAVISDNAIVEQFRNVDINRSSIHDGINDWLIGRDKILEQFYRGIGVKMYNSKKAQVNEEELESNNQLLIINTSDMIEEQNKGLERVNKHWGLNMKARLNENFVIKGGTDNANQTTEQHELSTN